MTYLINQPLTSLIVTLAAFLAAQYIYKKSNYNGLLSPIAIAILMVIAYIGITGLDYAVYMQGAQIIHVLLGPATVALAIPLYKQIQMIGKKALPITFITIICCLFAAFFAGMTAYFMGANDDIQRAILTKSVTTPIAIGIAEKINALPSLAVLFVFATGIPGTMLASHVFKWAHIHNDKAKGFALGITCHGLGVAKAFQHNEITGTYAILGMSIMGLASGILIPLIALTFL